MKKNLKDITYDADAYVRLSKEDGDIVNAANREESNSIVNQKELIKEFLKKHPEIHIHKFRVDDGFTGVNFERPAFQEMIEDVKQGIVKCIIVKDLSRFGRDYIEVGRYIEKIFPYLGVRFIAINDNYDSIKNDKQADHIMVPFKNLMNDAYCRDISVKVRSQLEVKRNNGEFIGPFAPYGYQKSESNKNELIADEYAADIVRDIFRYFIQGYSAGKIAGYLNELGVLPPMDYKQEKGSRFYTSFKLSAKSQWNHVTILRILQNEVYTGAVVQGKYTTPNHKVKKKTMQPVPLWTKVADMHEPIITREEFRIVQKLLQMDTRISPREQNLHILAGLLKCGDCKGNMVIKTVPSGGRKYRYYVCGEHKYHKNCSPHSIPEKKLLDCVCKMLNCHVEQFTELQKVLDNIADNPDIRPYEKQKNQMLKAKQKEIDKYDDLRLALYEDYQEKLIDKEEYAQLKERYTVRIRNARAEMERILAEISITGADSQSPTWILIFRKCGKIEELNRETAATLIDRILVYDKARIEIQFNFQNEYKELVSLVNQYKGTNVTYHNVINYMEETRKECGTGGTCQPENKAAGST